MAVPILRQGTNLIASVQSNLTDSEWLQLQESLLRQVGEQRIQGVIIDVAALDVLDSFATRILRSMWQVLKLRGAETVMVGIQPEVAYAMVQLGLIGRLSGMLTALDLDDGLALLKRSLENRGR